MLILVRHGRTVLNASAQLCGRLDAPLDDLGRRQALALSHVAELEGAARVVSSPLVRARETASGLGPPVTVDERWVEVDYGVFDGLPLGEVPAWVWDKWGGDLDWAPDGGESLAAVAARVRGACEDLWAEAVEHDVVVVSHVSPIKAAVAWALGVGEEATWRMTIDTASICRIGAGRFGPSLRTFNETWQRPSS